MVRVHEPVMELMKSTGFCDVLGEDHFLLEDEAVSHLFHKALDPSICVYECDERAFKECQDLPKQTYQQEACPHTEIPIGSVTEMPPGELWERMHDDVPPLVVDVREPREFARSHVPQAELRPLPRLMGEETDLPQDRPIVFVCRGGRRSSRAAYEMQCRGFDKVTVLKGGMLAWEAENLLAAVDDLRRAGGKDE
jgi:SulP family sulfate permease